MGLFSLSWRRLAACAVACVLASQAQAQAQAAAAPDPTVPAAQAPVAAGDAAPVKDVQEPADATVDQTPKPNPPNLSFSQFSGKILGIGLKVPAKPDKLKPGDAKAPNYDAILFQPDGGYPAISLLVITAEGKTALKAGAKVGDRIWIQVDDPVKATKVIAIDRIARPVSLTAIFFTVAGVTTILMFVAVAATSGKPEAFLIGHDGLLSNSQCQLALWFGVVAIAYATALVLRLVVLGPDFVGGVSLTNNVLVLTGLSGLSFGGAKIIATRKQDSAAAAAADDADSAVETAKTVTDAAVANAAVAQALPETAPTAPAAQAAAADAVKTAAEATTAAASLVQKAAVTPAAADKPAGAAQGVKASFADLFRDANGQADIGDFQMILISFVAAAIFAVASLHFLTLLDVTRLTTLPDVDTALLGAFGLGHGAYLIKKAAVASG